ncbi:MAG: hypothetical protein H6840_01630 [Planctomycetes bacterium]|nr:hypothetical protein [Planctomycetota bacterium]
MRCLLLAAALLLAPALLADDSGLVAPAATESDLGSSGLRFTTSDESFEFTMITAVQFRYTWHDTRGEGANGDNGRDFHNFRFYGARSFFHGHVFNRSFQYRLWLVWSWPGTVRIEDAYFRWAPEEYFNVTVGQMRVPATWEYLVDHERTALPDRAIADAAFSQGWGKGIEISGRLGLYDTEFDQGLLTWAVGLFNGALASVDGAQGRGTIAADGVHVTDQQATEQLEGGFRNSDWKVNPEVFGQIVDAQMMVAARLEFHPMGEVFKHMVDIGALDDTAAWFFMVGLAVNWMSARVDGYTTFLDAIYHNSNAAASLAPPASGRKRVDASIFHATVDGHYRWIGLSVNWALHYRTVSFNATGRLNDFDLEDDPYVVKGTHDFGATIDVGYFVLPDQLVLSTRFSYVDFDEFKSREIGTSNPIDGDAFGADSYEYGGGLCWFIHGDNLKLQADYRYVAQQLPHGNSRSGATAGTVRVSDWRVFHEIRLQLQWMF